MRIGAILAIAQRDLRMELAGRRGLVLPIIMALLLLPLAVLRSGGPDGADTPDDPQVFIQGDRPAWLEQDDAVVVGSRGLPVERRGQTYEVRGEPSARLRDRLDHSPEDVSIAAIGFALRVPRRSILFALVSASTLTGSVSGSIGGERSRKTLQALLTAMVSRWDIVVGKWLAWTGFGTVSALCATVAGIAVGTVPLGPWVLCIPLVPALTVAFGLWLVRRSPDVMAGTTISLRVIPAVLSTAALASWLALQLEHDWIAALIPMGGILMGAGALFDDDPLLLTATLTSTVVWSALLLAATARDLEQGAPPLSPLNQSIRGWASLTVQGLVLWHFALTSSLVWAAASETSTAVVPASAGPLAAGALLGGLTLVYLAAPGRPLPAMRPWSAPKSAIAASLVGVGLALSNSLVLDLDGSAYSSRLLDAQNATWAGPVAWMVVVLGQEAFFRGLLLRSYGMVAATIAFVLIATPTEPLWGLAIAAPLGLLVQRTGAWWTALMAQLVWALTGDLGVLPTIGAAATTAVWVALLYRMAPAEARA